MKLHEIQLAPETHGKGDCGTLLLGRGLDENL